MNKEKLLALIAKKEARKATLKTSIESTDNVQELRSMQSEWNDINDELTELRAMLKEIEDEEARAAQQNNNGQEERGERKPEGELRNIGGSSFDPRQAYSGSNNRGAGELEQGEVAEKRGKDLKEERAITVATEGVILPKHRATDIKPTFNEVSSLLDLVNVLPLQGGESFEQPYLKGYGTGDYKGEGEAYASAEPTFGSATISKTKVTSYSEISEEVEKLPLANYGNVVVNGTNISMRKKITREVLVGNGTTGHLVGIFDDGATAIDSAKDLGISAIDTSTLDEIVFSYGGDEDVEDAAVLILNKKDLKAFSRLRTNDGKKFHTIITDGNKGTIDGIPFIINSACNPLSVSGTAVDSYCMAYGSLSAYTLAVFSDTEIKRSDDFKFSTGMICHKGSIFIGGNVTSHNGFLRVKKVAAV